MYDNENPNGFGSNPEENNDDNISGTENNNFEEVNSQQVSQDAVNSSEQNTEQKAEQESSVYRQSYVNDEHHNADDVSGNSTYYSQGSNNSSNDSTQNDSYYNNTQNGRYYNSNSNNSQNNGYYYSTNDSQTNNGYNYNSNNNNNGNGKKKRTLIAVVAVCVVLLAGTIGISAAYISKNKDSLTNVLEDGALSNNNNNSNSNNDNSSDSGNYESIGSTNTQNDANSSSTSGVTVTDVSSVVSSAMPSVVAITSKTLVESRNDYSQDIWEYYFGGGNSGNNKSNSYEEDAAGSGIIVDQTSTELLIVTNNHVVEGADSLKIQFAGTESKDSVDGYIKGTDSTKDVAVVAVKLKDIPSDVLKNIKKATLGDSDKVNVGEGVIAIGNALGYGQSVTTGIISAKDRKVQLENQTMTLLQNKTMKLLQTDAAINGGNSGGALLNSKGEVIGINVAKYSSSGSSSNASVEGMGFAIPISSVKDIISDLETKETRTKVSEDERGYLGISGFDVDEQTSQAYSIPQGIQVQSVVKGGPAENAGIAASDVI